MVDFYNVGITETFYTHKCDVVQIMVIYMNKHSSNASIYTK